MTQTLLPERGSAPDAAPADRIGPLGRVARWTFRHRHLTVVLWLLALVGAFGASTAFAGEYTADYSAPKSDSRAAQELLKQRFPELAGDTITVVVRSEAGIAAAKPQIEELLADFDARSHVKAVDDPYVIPGSISADGKTAIAALRLDVANPVDMPRADTEKLLETAKDAKDDGLTVALGGQAVQLAEQGEIGSEGIGFAAAAIILLITFGSLVAAGLPLLIAAAGLAVSSMLIPVVAELMPVPDWSTALAAMLGIGIGIDYVLLMVTRFREWRREGLDNEAATVATLDTAGRSVLLAGSTVVVSMLGLFAMGLSFMRGAAVAAILGVAIAVAASLTLLPALLGYLGNRIDSLRLPLPRRRKAATQNGPSKAWLRWSEGIARHRILASVAGVAILLALATPFLGITFGFPDAGNDPADRSNRQAYDMQSEAFGPGSNGPLLLTVELPDGGAKALEELSGDLRATDGVAAVSPPRLNEAGDAAVLTVVPTTGPQDTATEDLIRTLRDDVIPAATGLDVHVGGFTATAIDSTDDVVSRLPLLIGGVVLLSMFLLLVSFRSIAVAVKAAVMNLLSVAASYGLVALVLQGGWAGQLLGIDTETPLPAFIPVLMFAILFGLSMDYEVFLVARMREVWVRTDDNARSIVGGLAGTGRVITAAAAIMVAVFAAFIPSPDVFLKVIGVGMAAAILIDATVVRMILVPAVMHLLGRANWWLPRWLDRMIPQLHVEGRPEVHTVERPEIREPAGVS